MAQAPPLENEPQPSVSWLILERLSDVVKRMDALDLRMGRIEDRMDALDLRMGRIENRMDALDLRMGRIEDRMDRMDVRMDRTETRMDRLEQDLRGEIASIRTWIIALFVPSLGLMTGVLIKLFV